MNRARLLASLVAITLLPFLSIQKASARYDPYLSDPTTSFFGRLIMLNDELSTAEGSETRIQQTFLLEAALERFDLRGNRLTPTNRFSLQPSNLPTASGGGRNLSRDGLCAVGYQDSGFFTPFHALRWTQATGPMDLGTLGGGQSFGTDTNQNCSVVVGYSEISSGAVHAFRWVSPGPIEDLNVLAGANGPSRALGVNSNGSVIVGEAEFPAGAFTRKGAFRWAGGAFTDLIPGLNPSIATAVSADGTIVVGQVGTSTASQAFRWKQGEPTVLISPLGTPPTADTTAAAIGVSDNGKIVVGISNPSFLSYQDVVTGWNPGTAFRWAESGPNAGVKDLNQLLTASGVNMTGITLVSVTGISPDGQWIQGRATTAQTGPNETVAFIIQFCDENIVGGMAACSTTAVPFTLAALPDQVAVLAGQNVSTTITVTPESGFAQPVSFSCGGLPVGATCAFNPATVTPAGGPVNTTLTISTNGGAVASPSTVPSSSLLASMLAPIALVPVGLLMGRKKHGNQLIGLVTGCLILAAMVGLLSCNSSDSTTPPATNSGGGAPATGTPAGTSTVTVTATSGSSTTGVPVSLTVTR